MSKTLIIGTCTFLYPENGTKPGWGESAACWAEAVTDKLATLSGANDICTTAVSVIAAQSCPANVGTGASALAFPIASVISFVVSYTVVRGSTAETGIMNGAFVACSWIFSHEHIGCAGMCFDITPAGQVQYYSDAGVCGTITFNARTFAT